MIIVLNNVYSRIKKYRSIGETKELKMNNIMHDNSEQTLKKFLTHKIITS